MTHLQLIPNSCNLVQLEVLSSYPSTRTYEAHRLHTVAVLGPSLKLWLDGQTCTVGTENGGQYVISFLKACIFRRGQFKGEVFVEVVLSFIQRCSPDLL